MRPDASPAEARAIDWLIRQRDPAFDDWDGFADWLDEDSEHAAIFRPGISFSPSSSIC